MEPIGLIAAMSLESDAVLRLTQGWKRTGLGSLAGKCFELSGHTCYLVTSGMGVQRASEAARNLIETHAPRILISFGIAGAVEEDLSIGDVITAGAVCRLDQGVAGPCLPLAAWPQAAQAAAGRALSRRGARLLVGTAVTTGGSQVTEYQPGTLLHPVLEMETAGIAQVAAEKGIPLFSLRAISDGPRDPIPFDLGEIMDEHANPRAGRILKTMIRHPSIVFQSGRLIHNSRTAADNAAIALTAALSQTFF